MTYTMEYIEHGSRYDSRAIRNTIIEGDESDPWYERYYRRTFVADDLTEMRDHIKYIVEHDVNDEPYFTVKDINGKEVMTEEDL